MAKDTKIQQFNLGVNVEGSVENNILTLKIDLSERNGPSSTGKTIIVATTGAAQTIPGTDIKLGLNAYTPKK